MTFVYRVPGKPKSLAILAGAFNPPTMAHIALIESALNVVDEVLLAIPRTFPHKQYHGATLEQRLEMLRRIAAGKERVSAAVAEGGLFAEIAREALACYGETEIYLLCGRDAAERILCWNYDDPLFVDRMLQDFRLLVAPRCGAYVPESRFSSRVRTLPMEGNFDECSSTQLRDVRRDGGDWRPLVPECIADLVEDIYR